MTGSDALLRAGVAAALSVVLTWAALAHARERRLLAHPEERSSHSVPTPSGGGIGLVTALLLVFVRDVFEHEAPTGIWLVGGAVCLTIVGYRDDARSLRPGLKMGVVLLATWFTCRFALLDSVQVPGGVTVPFGLLAVPLTLFWYAGFVNAFNFMDGINGIAGLTAVVTGGALALLGLRQGDAVLATLGAVTAGAALGYLPWNFPRARIFMGDAGSLPLGLVLAAGIVRAAAVGALPFPAGVLLVGPYVFDTTFTLIRRARRGERLSEAHREHLYQRLQRLVGSHTAAALTFAGLAAGCAALAWEYPSRGPRGQVLSLLLPLVAMLLFALFVALWERRRRERQGIPGEAARTP